MQLPDYCFGVRWPIGLYGLLSTDDAVFDICEAALPEVTIVWEISFQVTGTFNHMVVVQLSLGDQLPANDAGFAQHEQMFPSLPLLAGNRNSFLATPLHNSGVVRIRKPFRTAGRRVIARMIRLDGTPLGVGTVVTVSSIPTEAPDWLVSR